MATHYVVCMDCGTKFDLNKKGGYYFKDQRRYVCKSCMKQRKANGREARTGMRQSKTAMIIKIVVGILFLITGFTMSKASEVITGIIIGLALIAWALIPFFKARKQDQTDNSENDNQ